MKLLNN